MSNNISSALPSWVMILIFILILTVLAMMGSLFVFILGAILEILVFAVGYDAAKSSH